MPVGAYADMANDLYDLMDSMKMEGAIIGIMADRNTVMFMPYYLFDNESLTKTMTSLSFSFKAGTVAKERGANANGRLRAVLELSAEAGPRGGP